VLLEHRHKVALALRAQHVGGQLALRCHPCHMPVVHRPPVDLRLLRALGALLTNQGCVILVRHFSGSRGSIAKITSVDGARGHTSELQSHVIGPDFRSLTFFSLV